MLDLPARASVVSTAAVHIVCGATSARSYFGGDPRLPSTIPWPSVDGKSLDFLARISLSELQHTHAFDWLPHEGALLFFFDCENEPWGFDPKDRGHFAVVLAPDLPEPVRLPGKHEPRPRAVPVTFELVQSLPGPDRPETEAVALSGDRELDQYGELMCAAFGGLPEHQIGGYPGALQGDIMELECQLVSNGLYCGSPAGYKDPRAAALAVGQQDWKLLLQVDSDSGLDLMWGDSGRLYFWVRKEDAKRLYFGDVWCVLQCF